jgi:hypothetical protein
VSENSDNTGSTEASDVGENAGSTGNDGEDEEEEKDDNDNDNDGDNDDKVETVTPEFQDVLPSSLEAQRGTQAHVEDLDEDAEPTSAQASGLFRGGNSTPESSELSDVPVTQGDPGIQDQTDEYSMDMDDVPVGESRTYSYSCVRSVQRVRRSLMFFLIIIPITRYISRFNRSRRKECLEGEGRGVRRRRLSRCASTLTTLASNAHAHPPRHHSLYAIRL